MTPALYRICCGYADEALLRPDPRGYAVGSGAQLPDYSCAVYIALDMDGAVDYVGSVDRATGAAARNRLAEHVKDHDRFRSWAVMYVVPLRPDTPHDMVLAVEGRIGAHLKPQRNQRLPRLGAWRRRGIS